MEPRPIVNSPEEISAIRPNCSSKSWSVSRIIGPNHDVAVALRRILHQFQRPASERIGIDSASAIVILILWSVIYFSPLWERFDRVILQTEPRRYAFAILFVAVWWGINEWGIRGYQHAKEKAAARLEARFSASSNRS